MLLRLQQYSFDLVYKPGKQLVIAVTLSRAPGCSEGDQSKFDKDLETVCAIVDATLSDPLVSSLWQETKTDGTLQAVCTFIHEGWPQDKQSLPAGVAAYYNIRDELICEDSILFRYVDSL